jgi:hypothetical protein
MAEDFDPDAWLREFDKNKKATPPVDPLYSTGETFTTRTAKAAWPYVKAAGTGAAKEVAGDVQTLGELLPDPLSPLLPDVAKQARAKGGKELREWTKSEDPEHPNVEAAGRFGATLGEAWALPLPSLAKAREAYGVGKGLIEKAGEALFVPSAKPPYYPKGVPFGPQPKAIPARITQKGVQGSVENPAYVKAREAAEAKSEKAEAKVGAAAKGVEKATQAGMRGAVAGAAVEPGQDKEGAALTGAETGGAMSVLATAYQSLPPKVKMGMDFAAVAPIAAYFWHHGNLSPEQAVVSAVGWMAMHGVLYSRHMPSIPGMGAAILQSPAAQVGAAATAVRVPEALK